MILHRDQRRSTRDMRRFNTFHRIIDWSVIRRRCQLIRTEGVVACVHARGTRYRLTTGKRNRTTASVSSNDAVLVIQAITDDAAFSHSAYGFVFWILPSVFEDGSVGWYEAGWGPMMSETAHFVKDMIGPNGSVSIVAQERAGASSADHDTHTRTNALRIHHAALDAEDRFAKPDALISTENEPGHQDLCERQQRLFLRAIRGEIDLSEHHEAAINSLSIVFAADESVRSGEVVRL